MSEYGVVTEPRTIRMERLLPGPIERVWDYLTDSAKRGKWFAAGKMDLRVGGDIEFFFHHADLSAEKTPPAKHKDKANRREHAWDCRRLRAAAPVEHSSSAMRARSPSSSRRREKTCFSS